MASTLETFVSKAEVGLLSVLPFVDSWTLGLEGSVCCRE